MIAVQAPVYAQRAIDTPRWLCYAIPELTKGNAMPLDIRLDDVVQLRKPHPCGSYEWRVVRVGADIGLRCLKCNRRVLLPRRKFERSVKKIVAGDHPGPLSSRWLKSPQRGSGLG